MTIWHKRKRNVKDVVYGAIMTACIMGAAWAGLGRVEAYEIDNQETIHSRAAGCAEEDIIDWLALTLDDVGYHPAYAPPARKPE